MPIGFYLCKYAVMTDYLQAKIKLRNQTKMALSQISSQSFKQCSTAVCQHFVSLINDKKTSLSKLNIATYAADGMEINLAELHDISPYTHFHYPLCHQQGMMSFHRVNSVNDLQKGKHGILEPKLKKEIPISEIDIFLCPGLAFGKDGSRLGRGGGYYDRFLSKIPSRNNTIICGVTLEQQFMKTVPHEPHDILMNIIITEKGIHHCQT